MAASREKAPRTWYRTAPVGARGLAAVRSSADVAVIADPLVPGPAGGCGSGMAVGRWLEADDRRPIVRQSMGQNRRARGSGSREPPGSIVRDAVLPEHRLV